MANDVTIVVEASLGDTLLKLELAKIAVGDLEDAGFSAGKTLGDDTDRNSFSSRIGNLRRALGDMGDRGPLGMVVRGFGNLAAAMLAPLDLGMKFAQNFQQLGTIGQSLVGVLVSLPVALIGVATAIAVVTFAATALATILGTLVAIVADLVAPVTLVAGLLGGLAAGFVIAAKKAADGGGHLNEFSKKLDTLHSMFDRTSGILAHVFLPYLVELAGAAETALKFLDRIVKLPLGQAFRAIDTRGTKLLGKFVDRVAEVLSKPIKLAFHVAFEDTAFSNMVSDWWHRFVGFLFGTTERHPVELRPGVFKIKSTTVDGVFQPFIEWFDRHHFTRQGIGIGRQILAGVLNSGMRQRIVNFIVQVLRDSARQGGRAFLATLNQPMGPMLLALVRRTWNSVDQIVNDAGHRARQAIISAMQSAWNAVLAFALNIWNHIVDAVTHPISINIDWPSPPSWLGNLNPFGGGGSSVPSRGGGGGSSNPTFAIARASSRPAMAGGNVIINAGPMDSMAARRKVVAQIDRDLQRRWLRSGR